jgi:hypothetical protein
MPTPPATVIVPVPVEVASVEPITLKDVCAVFAAETTTFGPKSVVLPFAPEVLAPIRMFANEPATPPVPRYNVFVVPDVVAPVCINVDCTPVVGEIIIAPVCVVPPIVVVPVVAEVPKEVVDDVEPDNVIVDVALKVLETDTVLNVDVLRTVNVPST